MTPAFTTPVAPTVRPRRSSSRCSSRFATSSVPRSVRRRAPSAKQLQPGQQLQGTVTRVVHFGAFVDVGSHTGLVHISEIADTFVKNVSDYVCVGDAVTVSVISHDVNGKLALSIKQAAGVTTTGYDRVIQLGGDWGHPWNDDASTKYADFGPRPPARPNDWQPDPNLFRPFQANKPPARHPPSDQ